MSGAVEVCDMALVKQNPCISIRRDAHILWQNRSVRLLRTHKQLGENRT
jgi:hypothetical protein